MQFVSNLSASIKINEIVNDLLKDCQDQYDLGVLFVSQFTQTETIDQIGRAHV